MKHHPNKINRPLELPEIRRFLAQPGSGFTFFRGRRRVGKTWLLKEISRTTPNCFYFMGLEDASDAKTRQAFAEAWYEFSKDRSLVELSGTYRTWARIFKELEFNSIGVTTAIKILSCLGQGGASFSTIQRKSGLPHSTIASAVSNLLEYEILFEHHDYSKDTQYGEGTGRYYLRDFFLNFYFQVLERFSNIVRNNDDQLVFTSKALMSSHGFYIPDFSGKAFELLCERLLLRRNLKLPLKDKLLTKSVDYKVGNYQDGGNQINLVVQDETDRLVRLIECKWIDQNQKFSDHLKQAAGLVYPAPNNFGVKKYLLPSYSVTASQCAQADKLGVGLLTLDDLFDQ